MLGLTAVSTIKGPIDARADRPDGRRDGGYRGRSGAVAVPGGCAPWITAWCHGTQTQCPWNAHNQWGQRSARLLASANKPNTSRGVGPVDAGQPPFATGVATCPVASPRAPATTCGAPVRLSAARSRDGAVLTRERGDDRVLRATTAHAPRYNGTSVRMSRMVIAHFEQVCQDERAAPIHRCPPSTSTGGSPHE